MSPTHKSTLFNDKLQDDIKRVQNLAEMSRPHDLGGFVGQKHLLADGKPLKRIIDEGVLTSIVLWGPPGTGKTTLARIIANCANAEFEEFSAVTSKIDDIKKVIERSTERLSLYEKRTIVFLDEFHRFNKAQQDAFLPHLENGLITLIGATTENPYFVLNPALRSRVTIFSLKSLNSIDIEKILERSSHLLSLPINFIENCEGINEIVRISNGDARIALNLFELSLRILPQGVKLSPEFVREVASLKADGYARLNTNRYDLVSAFIKSMRGSNPDAALYWMVRLLNCGEAPEYISRRMIIFAAEDIGLASPSAITIAVSVAKAVEYIGMPEAEIPLAFCATYLAACPKSNSAYLALASAKKDVEKYGSSQVPLHLRNYDFENEKGTGDQYKYPHDFAGHFIPQQYLPDEMGHSVYYIPTEEGYETRIKERILRWRSISNVYLLGTQ